MAEKSALPTPADLAATSTPCDKDKASGHYFDFHALRYCTDTSLMVAGVPPTVVMLFMRHKTMKVSMVTYNDPRMTDARRALSALHPVLGTVAAYDVTYWKLHNAVADDLGGDH